VVENAPRLAYSHQRESNSVRFTAAALERTRPSNLGLAVEKGHQPTAQDLAALGGDIITIHYNDR
jgi:hypothetical protein